MAKQKQPGKGRGGKREGSGRHSNASKGIEKAKAYAFSALPSSAARIKAIHGSLTKAFHALDPLHPSYILKDEQ